MGAPNSTVDQNLLPVQAYFDVYGNFQTFIGQGKAFYASANPIQSGLTITNSTLDSSPIGSTSPSTGNFTNISTVTGTISTNASSATDIVNFLTLQSYAAGISWKNPVTAATTANITLSGLQTVDTVSLVAGNTVMVKNQTNAAQNGIYTVSSGAWTYAAGCTTWAQYVSALVFVEYGGQAGSAWYCTAQPGGTLGTTAMNWSNFSVSTNYSAGTGLTLTGYVFSITATGVSAATYGSASTVPVIAVNLEGQITSATNTSIAINASQITAGTIASSLLSGSYTGITGLGTVTAGTWNAGVIGASYGGTGVAGTITGYVYANGTGAHTASTTIPTTALSGTITNAQLTNSTISGVSLGGNLAALTAGTNITFSSGTTYNGSAAITINATVPSQVYPSAGIANSTGTAWGASYSTTGSGTVVALATSPTFVTPTLGAATATSVSSGTFTATGAITGSASAGAFSYGTLSYSDVNIFASYTSSVNNYNQIILQNTNSGSSASSDYVVSNNLGTNTTYYGDFGINSNGWTGTLGTASLSAPNVVYFSSASVDLVIGTVTANAIRFVTNSGADNASVSSAGVWSFTNTVTGSISGNAATATTATTATNATNTGTTDDTTNASTVYPVWKTTTSGNLPEYTSSTKLKFVPNTGTLSATAFSGSGASLTGIVTSLTAGSGITLSGSTGAVTVSESLPGLQSSGQQIITTSMTLTSANAGSNILLIPTSTITITFPSTANTFNLSNPSTYPVNLVFGGTDFKNTLQPGETVILAGDGGGYWRTVACGLQGGLQGAKAWVAATATGGTPTINGAYNVSSMTYTATGVFYINFTNALPNANYSMYSHCNQLGTFTYSNNGQNTTGCGFSTYTTALVGYNPASGTRLFAGVFANT